MRVAIVASNFLKIDKNTKKGTEIFVYTLINSLVKYAKGNDLLLTVFSSGNSSLPIKIESVGQSSIASHNLPEEKHMLFELALISKAFSMQDNFDLFHINIGNGDIVLPFARFIKKPVLITLHYSLEEKYIKKYFDLFKDLPNLFYISTSNFQRKLLPNLNYISNIYHGVNPDIFQFSLNGGEGIMWAGRAVPEKGVDFALEVAKRTRRKLNLFATPKILYQDWFKNISEKINETKFPSISLVLNKDRFDLIKDFQNSKLFLFPIRWEEPFGLVLIEAMSCGTPIVAYARGSVPEIIKDGKTGFIVNPSDDDIRGDWIIKKTGVAGLVEAVEKIYSMPQEKYLLMRKACRDLVEEKFTTEIMAKNYIEVYKKITAKFS